MKLSKRESVLLGIAMATLAFFIYYNFFLSNIIDRYILLKKDINTNRQQLLTLQKDQKDLDALITEIDKNKKQLAELEMIIPSSKKMPEIIVQLEDIAKSTGVKLKGINFENISKNNKESNGNATDNESNDKRLQSGQSQTKTQGNESNMSNDYVEIPIQLDIQTSYGNAISFLKALETFKRLFIIKNITLSKKSEETGENLEMQLEVCAYAVKIDQKLMAEPTAYDFMTNNYGRKNPFKALQPTNSAPTPSAVKQANNPSKDESNSKANSANSPSGAQTQDKTADFMERFFKMILEDAKKSDSGK